MRTPFLLSILPMVAAVYTPTCAPRLLQTVPPTAVHVEELWQPPIDPTAVDLLNGPWGHDHAPDPQDTFRLVARKHQGTNPGVTVVDREGRKWHVKQAPDNDQGAEGPIEVVLSRVLSAVGYHQPPVYFLPHFFLDDATGTHKESGGRFRLDEKSLKDRGIWSWQQNPFVGTRPYQGLLVILMLFNSSDLKNDNNTLYDVAKGADGVRHWYVVRDLGTALGETGRLAPTRGDLNFFLKSPFIADVRDGFVAFNYHGWHQELVRRRITPDDVAWAIERLDHLSARQWRDAFAAGGYDPAVAARFIQALHDRMAQGQRLAAESR